MIDNRKIYNYQGKIATFFQPHFAWRFSFQQLLYLALLPYVALIYKMGSCCLVPSPLTFEFEHVLFAKCCVNYSNDLFF